MTDTLFVVAHRSGARLLLQHGKTLDSIEELDHPQGRMRNIDRDADRPGRTHDSSGTRHAFEGHASSQDQIAMAFARTLARRMAELRIAGRYDHAVLVAEPSFLGMLRHALDKTTEKRVRATLDKDLAKVATRDLREHLERAT